ncbi:glycosyltransferase family 39 protein [Belnapia moabensis]|uniref:glycosyltransferase family 39 protein n=1 Tax=Belnapia moabensis TaxID=365533 RepID=UPI0005B9860D|nr:glycosyltransferase family 39 protein [Belnapia moabensis]
MPDTHVPDAKATAVPGLDAPRWPGRLLGLVAVLALATLIGLAWLWIQRNPMLSTWDEVMHLNLSMGDAMVLRSGDLAALRDDLLLQDRWLPPGLRLLGLPVAALFPADPQTALRLFASVMTALTAGVIWLGLRRVAGAAGAAAGVLVYLLAPLNMIGAQSFMTELPLHFAAACALALLLHEAVAPRASIWRLGLLGPVLGLGALAKLTFLPTIGLTWVGIALWRWWQDRDAPALRLRLLLPAVGLALAAWPFYLLNGGRYVGYAKQTAAGYAYFVQPEDLGLSQPVRVANGLIWDIVGFSGLALLAAGAVLFLLCWRRLGPGRRSFAALAVVAALPAIFAYSFSANQTDRYVGISLILAAFPVGLAMGRALRDPQYGRIARGAAVLVAAAGLVQLGLAWAIAVAGPLPGRPLRPLMKASWRDNNACDLAGLTNLLPQRPEGDRLRIGVFGLTTSVNPNTVNNGFLRRDMRAHVIELVNDSETSIDWDKLMAESAQLDLILLPEIFWRGEQDAGKTPVGGRHVADRSIPAYRERLEAAGLVEDRGAIANGPAPACAVHALVIRADNPAAQTARARPLRPEARE